MRATITGWAPSLSVSALSVPMESEHVEKRKKLVGRFNVRVNDQLEELGRTISSLQPVLAELDEARGIDASVEFLRQYERLLYGAFEYVELCQKFVEQMSTLLGRPGDAGGRFRKSVRKYRDQVARIVNHIKHNASVLRPVSLFTERAVVPGYYLESASDDGVVGPDRDLHDGGHTGISFCVDITRHFANTYLLSETALEHLALTRVAASANASGGDNQRWQTLVARISSLPRQCFVDELWKPAPLITVRKVANGVVVDLVGDVARHGFTTPPRGRVRTSFKGDGVTDTFHVPYFGSHWESLRDERLAELRNRLELG